MCNLNPAQTDQRWEKTLMILSSVTSHVNMKVLLPVFKCFFCKTDTSDNLISHLVVTVRSRNVNDFLTHSKWMVPLEDSVNLQTYLIVNP